MKRFLSCLLLLVFLAPLALRAETIIVGTADGDPTHVVPFGTNKAAIYTQTIYTSDKIGQAMTIASIAFNCATPEVTTTADVKLYLGETTRTSLDSSTGWVEGLTLVFDGSVTLGGEEWENFILSTPYEYSGTQSLIVAISTSNCATTNDLKWNWQEVTGACLHNNQANSLPQDFKSVKSRMTVIRLSTEVDGGTDQPGEGGDDEPVVPTLEAPVVSATATSATTIDLSWNAVADTATYQVYFGTDNIGTTRETSYTVQYCVPETEHCFTVVAELGEVKSEASAPACATTPAEGEDDPTQPEFPSGEEATIHIGEGSELLSYYAPIYDYYNKFGITQQIYTAEELHIGGGTVTSIAFKSNKGGGYERNISVYLANTDKEYYEGGQDWVFLTSEDAPVFEGTITTPTEDGWFTLELATPFEYTGGNIVVTVNDKTGSYGTFAQFVQWCSYSTGKNATDARCLYHIVYGDQEIDPLTLNARYGTFDKAGDDYLNSQIKFNVIPSESDVEVPEAIAFGKVLLNEYWTEKTSAEFTVKAVNTTITNITVDNDFFVLPAEIDYTANPLVLDLAYNRNAEVSGDVNATITVTYAEGTKEIPVTATVYAPVEPDVFELAREIEFTDNAYTDTPAFADLSDNYILPEETVDGKASDAVYSLELAEDAFITASLTGLNANLAVYKADFNGEQGPSRHNAYNGLSYTQRNFFFDFNKGSLEGWNAIDEDGNGYNWEVVTAEGETFLQSYSWLMLADGAITTANNVLVTEQLYNINENSVLSFDAYCYGHDFESHKDHIKVQVTKDGETFTLIEKILPQPSTLGFGNIVVDLGEKFAELGLVYGDYHVVIRHEENDKMYVCIDNVRLVSEVASKAPVAAISAVHFPAGKYYLIASAESEFTFNVSKNDIELAPPTGILVKDLTEESFTLVWNKVAKAEGYNIYLGEEKFSTTDTTYTFDNLETFTEYSLVVKSYAGDLESFASETVTVRTKDLPIAIPTNFEARALSSSEIVLTWDVVENATSYKVYGALVQDQELIATVTEPLYTVTELESARLYCFYVSAVRGEKETAMTEETCATTLDLEPFAPTNLVATTIDATTIGLTWEAGENSLKYNIYRDGVNVGESEGTAYVDRNLTQGTTYCYTVKGVRGDVESAEASDEACATTGGVAPTAPVAPVNLNAEVLSESSIKLSWGAVGNATSYKVYQGEENIATVELPTYTVEGLEKETEYCFTVTALNEVGESDKSSEVCATTKGDGIVELSSAINIYPNPVSDKLVIESEVNVEEVSVYNVNGQQTTVNGQQTSSTGMVIDVTNLNAGVYFVKVVTDNGEVVKRILKF